MLTIDYLETGIRVENERPSGSEAEGAIAMPYGHGEGPATTVDGSIFSCGVGRVQPRRGIALYLTYSPNPVECAQRVPRNMGQGITRGQGGFLARARVSSASITLVIRGLDSRTRSRA